MKKLSPTLLVGFVLIALVDTIGSIASKQLHFNYSSLYPISYIIYITMPFLIAKQRNRKSAIISGALLGLFDSTVGLKLSIALKANTGNININNITPTVIIAIAIIMTLTGSLCGLLGYWLSTKISTNK